MSSFRMRINQDILEMEYAVRGPIHLRAEALRREGKRIIACNIGNPQALGQEPLTYGRQIMSLLEEPSRIGRERKLRELHRAGRASGLTEDQLVPEYYLDRAETALANMGQGTGAYTASKGPLFIREAVARFIDERDGFDSTPELRADPEKIFLTDGASEAARFVLEMLIGKRTDGIMIPTPQYPLYSATIKRCGGTQVNYYPDEDRDWNLDRTNLEESISRAKCEGVEVRAIVVINPGNPTGAILDEKSIREVIAFARSHELAIIADEVYQENLYGGSFTSFAKVLGSKELPLFSLHSISKGFTGECGHRGGYLEVRNPPELQGTQAGFLDVLLKQSSVALCSNTAGQLLTYLMVSPPEPGTEPYPLYIKEKEHILRELEAKATRIREAFGHMAGVRCFGRTGAMYLFPRLDKLPANTNDFDYCMHLLEKTGIVTVNGSGFGQKEGTHHLRVAFLPPRELLEEVLPDWIEVHNRYVS